MQTPVRSVDARGPNRSSGDRVGSGGGGFGRPSLLFCGLGSFRSEQTRYLISSLHPTARDQREKRCVVRTLAARGAPNRLASLETLRQT